MSDQQKSEGSDNQMGHNLESDDYLISNPPIDPSADLFVKRPADRGEGEAIHRPSISYWKDAWLRLKKNRLAMASAAYIVLLALSALFVPPMLQYTHYHQEVWNLHLPPSLSREAVVVDGAIDYTPVVQEAAAGDDEFAVEPPAAPQNVRPIGEPLSVGIAIRWDAVPGAEGYRVYRSISPDTLGIPLPDSGPDELSFLDTNTIRAETDYYYTVLAFNAFGESEEFTPIKVRPRLALALDDALAFNAEAKVGETVWTHPHYLGTDYLGRDMLARVMIGARISLFIGFGAPLIYILVGVIYGSISGYFGGLIDDLMMRFADMVSTVPELLTVIMLQVFLGSGVVTLIIALVLVAWARSARQIRGETLKIREMEYVQAARVLGTSTPKIILKHLLPNVTGTILVLFTLAIPQAIFTEAFLSFIGLGIAPPLASWGSVTREGAKVFLTYPHELVVPAAFICLSMFAFNMLGDGLRDALDPKLRGAK